MNKFLKSILILLVIFIVLISISCKSNNSTSAETEVISSVSETEVKTTLTYYGDEFPQPVGYVNDFASIFEKEYIDKMENLITDLEKKTTAEIAVVTIDSLGDKSIETYAVKLFEAWGIGKKDINNGILFLVAMEERECRIEVGYGLENVITDVIAKHIIDEIVIPQFKEGKYELGSYECVKKIAEYILAF